MNEYKGGVLALSLPNETRAMSLAVKKNIVKPTRRAPPKPLAYPCGQAMTVTQDYLDQVALHIGVCYRCERQVTHRNARFWLRVTRSHREYLDQLQKTQ